MRPLPHDTRLKILPALLFLEALGYLDKFIIGGSVALQVQGDIIPWRTIKDLDLILKENQAQNVTAISDYLSSNEGSLDRSATLDIFRDFTIDIFPKMTDIETETLIIPIPLTNIKLKVEVLHYSFILQEKFKYLMEDKCSMTAGEKHAKDLAYACKKGFFSEKKYNKIPDYFRVYSVNSTSPTSEDDYNQDDLPF